MTYIDKKNLLSERRDAYWNKPPIHWSNQAIQWEISPNHHN